MSRTCCSKVTLDFFLGVHVPLMALTNMWNQNYSKKRLLWTTLVSCYVSSSKMKLWHFIRSIENIRVGHQFTLGLAHQLQQMQNCMKYFNLMVAEEINISIQKTLMSKCEYRETEWSLQNVLLQKTGCWY